MLTIAKPISDRFCCREESGDYRRFFLIGGHLLRIFTRFKPVTIKQMDSMMVSKIANPMMAVTLFTDLAQEVD